MAGRPRTPAALRIQEGNRGKRPIPPEPEVAEDMPARPSYLHGPALAKWKELAGKLHEAGLLKSVDGDALATYCVTYAQWLEATAIIKREGMTFVTHRGVRGVKPEVKIQQKALALMQQLMAQFGMSPKARANIGGPTKKAPEDPFSAAMRGTA